MSTLSDPVSKKRLCRIAAVPDVWTSLFVFIMHCNFVVRFGMQLRDEVEVLLNRASSLVSGGPEQSDGGRSSLLRSPSYSASRAGPDALSEAASRLKSSYDSTADKLRQFKKSASFRNPLSVDIPRSAGSKDSFMPRMDSPVDSPRFSIVSFVFKV